MVETPSHQASYLVPMIDYFQGLNERQKDAVFHMEDPLMIVAGANSGKTKVLTTGVAHLMANGVDSFGASMHPESSHFKDQMTMIQNQQTKRMTLDKTELFKEAEKV